MGSFGFVIDAVWSATERPQEYESAEVEESRKIMCKTIDSIERKEGVFGGLVLWYSGPIFRDKGPASEIDREAWAER